MRTLKFIDMTLRQASAQRGTELTFKEKLEIARSLDRLKADTIELAPISGSKETQTQSAGSCFHRADGIHLP